MFLRTTQTIDKQHAQVYQSNIKIRYSHMMKKKKKKEEESGFDLGSAAPIPQVATRKS